MEGLTLPSVPLVPAPPHRPSFSLYCPAHSVSRVCGSPSIQRNLRLQFPRLTVRPSPPRPQHCACHLEHSVTVAKSQTEYTRRGQYRGGSRELASSWEPSGHTCARPLLLFLFLLHMASAGVVLSAPFPDNAVLSETLSALAMLLGKGKGKGWRLTQRPPHWGHPFPLILREWLLSVTAFTGGRSRLFFNKKSLYIATLRPLWSRQVLGSIGRFIS